MTSLARGRVHIAALAVGTAQRALDESVTYAATATQGGTPIGEFQLVQAMIADQQTGVLAGRALVRDTARKWITEEDRRIAPSAAKLFCTEMAGKVADLAVQIHGGSGYMREVPVERIYRDVRLLRLYEGTSEIQRLIIGGGLIKAAKKAAAMSAYAKSRSSREIAFRVVLGPKSQPGMIFRGKGSSERRQTGGPSRLHHRSGARTGPGSRRADGERGRGHHRRRHRRSAPAVRALPPRDPRRPRRDGQTRREDRPSDPGVGGRHPRQRGTQRRRRHRGHRTGPTRHHRSDDVESAQFGDPGVDGGVESLAIAGVDHRGQDARPVSSTSRPSRRGPPGWRDRRARTTEAGRRCRRR